MAAKRQVIAARRRWRALIELIDLNDKSTVTRVLDYIPEFRRVTGQEPKAGARADG